MNVVGAPCFQVLEKVEAARHSALCKERKSTDTIVGREQTSGRDRWIIDLRGRCAPLLSLLGGGKKRSTVGACGGLDGSRDSA